MNWLRREAGGLSVSFERRDAGGASKGEALEENIDTPQLALPRDRRRCSECNPPSVARSWLSSSPSSPASACERRLGAALGVPRLDVQEASLLATRRNVPVALVLLPDAASSGIIEMGAGQSQVPIMTIWRSLWRHGNPKLSSPVVVTVIERP